MLHRWSLQIATATWANARVNGFAMKRCQMAAWASERRKEVF